MSIENLDHPSGRDSAHALHVVRTNKRTAQNMDASKRSASLEVNLALANLAILSAHPSRSAHPPLHILVGARLFGGSLDRRLAEGVSPASSRLLATRAQLIVSPMWRQELAQNWLSLLEVSDDPVTFMVLPNELPIRQRIIANEALIRTLVAALMAPMSAPRGVALARTLLGDGAGPIYFKDCPVDLARCLQKTILKLNPLTA
jgi:hypothetical protein